MLTIRPQRARVIGRARCLVQWKQLVRLVEMTSFQSASLIRKSSPSRVIPALLTRMSIDGISRQQGLGGLGDRRAVGHVDRERPGLAAGLRDGGRGRAA